MIFEQLQLQSEKQTQRGKSQCYAGHNWDESLYFSSQGESINFTEREIDTGL